MDKLVFSCFLLGGLTPDPGPTDSCALNAYCAAGLTNVGCNPPPITGGTDCDGKDAVVIDLLEPAQTYIVSFLNQIRDTFASGARGNPPAYQMFQLQWDASLATQAGHNARSCNIARDACRNTADFSNVGQITAYFNDEIAYVASLSVNEKINYILTSISFDAYDSGTASYSSYSASTNTENLANILNDRSKKVGCALMQYDIDGSQRYFYLVCNFSENVIEGQPLYTPGYAPAVGCATMDSTYLMLCLT